jgi:hypothetical protein
VRFEVLAAVRMMFWVLTLCILIGRYRRFGETHCLHLLPSYLHSSLHNVKTQKNNIVKGILILSVPVLKSVFVFSFSKKGTDVTLELFFVQP